MGKEVVFLYGDSFLWVAVCLWNLIYMVVQAGWVLQWWFLNCLCSNIPHKEHWKAAELLKRVLKCKCWICFINFPQKWCCFLTDRRAVTPAAQCADAWGDFTLWCSVCTWRLFHWAVSLSVLFCLKYACVSDKSYKTDAHPCWHMCRSQQSLFLRFLPNWGLVSAPWCCIMRNSLFVKCV